MCGCGSYYGQYWDLVTWAAGGMNPPNLLKFGGEVKYKRWHGNYVRCGVYIAGSKDLCLDYCSFAFSPGKVTAFVEFEGNTLHYRRNLILFSEFEVEKVSWRNDGTVAFKRKSEVSYHAYVEIRKIRYNFHLNKEHFPVVYSKFHEISQKDVFRLAYKALRYSSDDVEKQLKLFFENFYFIPRKKEAFRGHAGIKNMDNIWGATE